MTTKEKSIERYLLEIQNTLGASCKKITSSKYYISYDKTEWYLWPKSEKYVEIKDGEPVNEMYWGNIKSFYQRYISRTIFLPKNQGKLWSESDISILIDMLENEASINEIAKVLERYPQTIVDRLQLTFNNEINFLQITNIQWDFIISDIVDIYA